MASGRTNAEGLFRTKIQKQEDGAEILGNRTEESELHDSRFAARQLRDF